MHKFNASKRPSGEKSAVRTFAERNKSENHIDEKVNAIDSQGPSARKEMLKSLRNNGMTVLLTHTALKSEHADTRREAMDMLDDPKFLAGIATWKEPQEDDEFMHLPACRDSKIEAVRRLSRVGDIEALSDVVELQQDKEIRTIALGCIMGLLGKLDAEGLDDVLSRTTTRAVRMAVELRKDHL
jgi:hypothetical protein